MFNSRKIAPDEFNIFKDMANNAFFFGIFGFTFGF